LEATVPCHRCGKSVGLDAPLCQKCGESRPARGERGGRVPFVWAMGMKGLTKMVNKGIPVEDMAIDGVSAEEVARILAVYRARTDG
jgi:hypothetical protein